MILIAVPLLIFVASSDALGRQPVSIQVDDSGNLTIFHNTTPIVTTLKLCLMREKGTTSQGYTKGLIINRTMTGQSVRGFLVTDGIEIPFQLSVRNHADTSVITTVITSDNLRKLGYHLALSGTVRREIDAQEHTNAFFLTDKAAGARLSVCKRPSEGARLNYERNTHSLSLTAEPAATPGSKTHLSMLVSSEEISLPFIADLTANSKEIAQHGKFEATLDLWAEYINPYDPGDIAVEAVFTSPSGSRITVPGFLFQDYRRKQITRNDQPHEVLEPVGTPTWKIRFAPAEAGQYHYVVSVRTRRTPGNVISGNFESTRSANPGFIGISPRNKRYFEFSTGTPYFAIGHNVCWPTREGGTYDYDNYFSKMQKVGENYTRIWFCSWGIQLEGEQLDSYQLDHAWRLDYILELARKRGIYVKLCFDNFHDWIAKETTQYIPYYSENGGPIETPDEFFTNEIAYRHYLRRIRYILARWGYSTNLFAWELWNEMDYLVDEDEPQYMIDWCRRVARYIRQNDPYDHLITTSLGTEHPWESLWNLNEMDFAQSHLYISPEEYIGKEQEYDDADFVAHNLLPFREFSKPYLLAEWGFQGTNEHNPLNWKDEHGVHLHNAIWAAALSGAAGTAMPWWWDTYIEPNDLYHHYAAFSKFARGIDWPAHDWKLLRTPSGSKLRIIGMKSDKITLLWIQSPQHTWYNRIVKGKLPLIPNDKRINLSPIPQGTYRVEWWDTYKGGIITHYNVVNRADSLTLQIPAALPDIACKIIPVEP